jgi:ElaB/YqjD/DUF883 family membrane-anchored ribosome-binding protein
MLEANGRATIREVYELQGQVRREFLDALRETKEELLTAIRENRKERMDWIDFHEKKVHCALSDRHDAEDKARDKSAAKKELLTGCISFVEKHWRGVAAGTGIGALLVEIANRVNFL